MSWFYGGDSQDGKDWIWGSLWGNSADNSSMKDSVQTAEPEKQEDKSVSFWGW